MKIQEPELEIKGKQAFVTRQRPALDEACVMFGRDPSGLCIKVFYGNPMKEGDTLRDALWGDLPLPPPSDTRKNTTVFAGSQVQNILWRKGLSPRVFGIFEAEFRGMKVACQLTEFIEGECASKIEEVYRVWEATEAIGKEYGFTAQTKKMGVNDVIGGKNIDPQFWAWDKVSYKSIIEKIYYEKGRYGKIYYQNDDELGFHGGPRHSEDRVEYMRLGEVDFRGKVVWDIGCAGGFFLRYATKRGARRAIGFDMKDPLEAAFHAGNYLGHFNIDYIEADLSEGIPIEGLPKPDVAFFLSMNLHIGVPEQLKDFPFVVFEDNSYDGRSRDVLGKPWTDWFNDIKFVGRGIDHGDKAIYHLRK